MPSLDQTLDETFDSKWQKLNKKDVIKRNMSQVMQQMEKIEKKDVVQFWKENIVETKRKLSV